jgi:hypothetical protein
VTADAIDELVRRFLDGSLPPGEWTHSAHLVVGAWHVRRYGAAEAIERMRHGIRVLNQQHGTPNTESRGYHETITAAYLRLLQDALETFGPGTAFEAQVRAILESVLGDREVLLRFWSRDVLMSPEARARWVPPNVNELGLPGEWRSKSESG